MRSASAAALERRAPAPRAGGGRALLRFVWSGGGGRRRAAHAQEPPGLRCKEPAVARQPMGFSRDKSLERVRAGPAVARWVGCKTVAAAFSACGKGSSASDVCDNPATQKTFRHNSIRPRPQGCEGGMGPSGRSFAGIPGVNLAAKKTVAMPSLPARPGRASCARNASPAANLPKHQSGRAFTKRLLPQASSVAPYSAVGSAGSQCCHGR